MSKRKVACSAAFLASGHRMLNLPEVFSLSEHLLGRGKKNTYFSRHNRFHEAFSDAFTNCRHIKSGYI